MVLNTTSVDRLLDDIGSVMAVMFITISMIFELEDVDFKKNY